MNIENHITSAAQTTAAARYPSSDGGCRVVFPPAVGTHNPRSRETTRVAPFAHLHIGSFAHLHIGSFANSLKFSFSAKERDAETGLSYFGARYYSSDLSLWLSVDPMSGKYPSLSPYVYCADNPVKLVDPNGEELIVADNDESRNDILSIVNDYNRHRVTFDEDGRVHVDMTDLKKEDAGLTLLHDLEMSDKRFYFEASDVVLYCGQDGLRKVEYFDSEASLGCVNLSNGGADSKYMKNELPMKGFDGQVVISKSGIFFL